ncbi:MAG: M15 family metallopeptidase [Candidatus Dojkabacteria bacterium]
MSKIISAIIAFILSANTYTVVYTQESREEIEQTAIVTEDIVQQTPEEEISPVKTVTRSPVATSTTSSWWDYPSDIKGVTRSGNDLLVLVNKEYQLPSTYAPTDLVSICSNVTNLRCVNNTNFLIRNILISDLQEMVNAATQDGIDLSIRSAYRSHATQQSTYNYWLSVNGGNVGVTDQISARPGHSQHQLGTTLDFSSAEINDGLGGTFASTQASKWLINNAWKYGFVIGYPAGYESVTGYMYESWHYRYIGKANAQDMVNSGMILELYLRSKN